MKYHIQFIIISTFLISCKSNQDKIDSSSIVLASFKNIGEKGAFTLKIPTELKPTRGIFNDATLQYIDIDSKSFFLLIKDSISNIKLESENDTFPNEIPMSSIIPLQLEYINQSFHISKSTSLDISTAFEQKSYKITLEPETNKEKCEGFISFVKGKTYLYTILSWTIPENMMQKESEFKEIVNSFKEFNPN